jgi:hypothetical protein
LKLPDYLGQPELRVTPYSLPRSLKCDSSSRESGSLRLNLCADRLRYWLPICHDPLCPCFPKPIFYSIYQCGSISARRIAWRII